MRNFLIWSVWLLIYFIPLSVVAPGEAYFPYQILCSALLAATLLHIDKKYPGVKSSIYSIEVIVILTSIFAIFTLCTQIGYLMSNYILYDIYYSFQSTINTLEFIALCIGTIAGAFVNDKSSHSGLAFSNMGTASKLVLPLSVIDLRNTSIMEPLHRRDTQNIH